MHREQKSHKKCGRCVKAGALHATSRAAVCSLWLPHRCESNGSFSSVSPQKPAPPSPPPVSDWVTHSRPPQARLENPSQATTVRDGGVTSLPCCRTHTDKHVAVSEAERRVDEAQLLILCGALTVKVRSWVMHGLETQNVLSSFPVTVIADDMQEVEPRILGNIVVR